MSPDFGHGSLLSKSPLSVWPHLFSGAGHEKRRGEHAVEVVPGI